jgi:hypothetical protein
VGRGAAIALADTGLAVFATGRTIEGADLPYGIIRLRCDRQDDDQTANAFARVAADAGRLDILVNSAWGGYERMVEDGVFTWTLPFHDQPAHRWTEMMDAGVWAAFVCSQHAVAAISVYPGLVRTELVLEAARQGWLDLSASESPDFSGRVIAALYADPDLTTYSGRVVVAAEAAARYGIGDIDGLAPAPLSLEKV